MQIIGSNGLLVSHEQPHRITESINKSKLLPSGDVLVHWNMRSAQELVRLGVPNVPSPISSNYHYPGRDKPMAHQKVMAEFMTLNRRCFNFSDMGVGKSRSAAWATDYLMQCGLVKRALIVAPLSILKCAWEADIFATAMTRTVGVATGDAGRRKKVISSDCEFVIINHDGIKSSRLELKKAKFDLIIVDECSAVTNTTTQRWKALNSLLEDDTMLWMITGTPAANSPLQAYGLAKLVSPRSVPQFFTAWKDITMMKVSMFTFVPKSTAQADVFKVLQPAIRFNKKDCIDLPPVTFVEREFDMDPVQAKYYAKMKNEMLMLAADHQITAVNSGVLIGKLLQISAGAVYSDDGSVIDFRASARMNEMFDVIQESREKVLVFAQFKHSIAMIAKFLEEKGIECAVIQGSTPQDTRKITIDAFQNTSQYKVLILQPKVTAHGITLTAASTSIWFSPVASLETWLQANARIDRIGQQNPMTIVKLVGSPIERKTYTVLERRDAAQIDLLQMFKEELNEA